MAGEPTWVRKAPRESRTRPLLAALGGISWFTLLCFFWLCAGLVEGALGLYFESGYHLAFAGICQFAALNLFLLSSREDQ